MLHFLAGRLPNFTADLPSIPFSKASCKGFAEPYVSPVISMLYPCYIHVISICGQKQTAHPFLFPNVFPFSSHLKGAKAQIKIRRFKVETRRRRDVVQPAAGHRWPMRNNTRCKWLHRRYVESFLGTNWRQQAREFGHLRGFDTNLDGRYWRCWHICALGHVHFWLPPAQDMSILNIVNSWLFVLGLQAAPRSFGRWHLSYLLARRFLSLKSWGLSFLLYHWMAHM